MALITAILLDVDALLADILRPHRQLARARVPTAGWPLQGGMRGLAYMAIQGLFLPG